MTLNHPPETEFLKSCYVSIWLNAFLSSTESLESSHDSLALKLPGVNFGAYDFNVFEFLEFLRDSKVTKARVHLPVSGALDGLIDTGEYLDFALAAGEVITLLGSEDYALVPTYHQWSLFPLKVKPAMASFDWREVDRNFAEFLPHVSGSLEAFDLIAANQAAREIMISLDHDISTLQFPALQPERVTFLLGRLMRTLVIGELAKQDFAHSASSTKNRLFKENVEELITRSRSYLSQVSNYHWNQ
jgi:hypothetical protein